MKKTLSLFVTIIILSCSACAVLSVTGTPASEVPVYKLAESLDSTTGQIDTSSLSVFNFAINKSSSLETETLGDSFEAVTSNCGSPTESVEVIKRSRQHQVVVEMGISASILAELGGDIEILEVKLGTELQSNLGILIGSIETFEAERQITTPGNSSSIAVLQWEAQWITGTVNIERADGSRVGEIPFRALTTLNLRQLDINVEFTCPPAQSIVTGSITKTPDNNLSLLQLTSGIGENYSPDISHDNSKIVFISTRDGNAEIYLMNIDGTEQIKLTSTPNLNEDTPVFSPDDSRILFGAHDGNQEDIFLMNITGADIKNLSNTLDSNEGRPKFVPGIFVALNVVFDSDRSGNSEIYSASLEINGLGNIQNLSNRPEFHDRFPSYVSLTNQILFRSQPNGGGSEGSRLYLMEIDGKDVHMISDQQFVDWYPMMTLGNEWFAFVSGRDGNEEIYGMNINSLSIARLTNDEAADTTPVISSNHQWLVFASKREESSFQLYRLLFEPNQ